MANPFDGLKRRIFDVVARTMGYNATWVPANGSQPGGYTVRVLFNNPTDKKNLAGVEYDPFNWKMEYRFDNFPGLKQAADTMTTAEVVTIEGRQYYIRSVNAKWDGQTYIATLEPKP